jgi:hypothetical protein
MKFFCKMCYEESFEKADVYALNELELPVSRMWASLSKYIDGGHVVKVEQYHVEYKEIFNNFLQD